MIDNTVFIILIVFSKRDIFLIFINFINMSFLFKSLKRLKQGKDIEAYLT